MTRLAANVVLVIAAGLIYIALSAFWGHTSLNEGLGQEGPVYAAMITVHDLQGGTVTNRVWPAFPLAAAVPYTVTRNTIASFEVVDFAGLLVLIFASCLLLDAHLVPLPIKACAVFTLAVVGLPTAITAFAPAQPWLLGVAMTTLAVAVCETPPTSFVRWGPMGRWVFTAAAHVGATFAAPVGVMAPLYGLAKDWRGKEPSRSMIAVVPGLLVWLLVQMWARGGPAGLMDLLRLSRVRSDAVLWTEFTFILFGAYFVVTTLGGLTLFLWSRPRWIQDALRQRPELWALVVPALIFIGTAGLDAPPMISFLIPFWLIVVGVWARTQATSLLASSVLAGVVTMLTQHPYTRMTDISYFVDWFPYSVHGARVNAVTVSDAALASIWRMRVLVAVAGLVAFAAWRRRPVSWQRW